MGAKEGYTLTKMEFGLPTTIHFDGDDVRVFAEVEHENGDVGIIYYDENGWVDREQLLDKFY